MNAQEFAYWLQGFVELHGEMPTPEQWRSIKEHLALVFVKVTPQVKKEPFAYPNDLTKVPRLGDLPNWVTSPQITCSAGESAKLADAICKSSSAATRFQ